MKNYYEILEVNQKASKEVIEKAYKVLVKKYHPDLYTGEKRQYAETKIKEINEAYRILSDEFLREQYDSELKKEEIRKYNLKHESQKQTSKPKQAETEKPRKSKRKVGTLMGMVELTKVLISDLKESKEKREEIKETTEKNIFAAVLTLIIVIVLGVVLWFIPFTNGWMRELLIDNPISQGIIGLFT